jgi:malonyl-CoA O-methyltransferase
MQAEEAAMLGLLPDVRGATAIDAGCGSGRYAALLLARGARRVIAIDRSMAMLRQAARSVCTVRADLAGVPVEDRSIDIVVSGLVMMDVPSLPPIVGEWARVLKMSGVVICSTLHPRGRAVGWTRTFHTPDSNGALPSHWHTCADFEAAFRSVGLAIDAVLEPPLDAATGRAGTGDREPVALVVRARARG